MTLIFFSAKNLNKVRNDKVLYNHHFMTGICLTVDVILLTWSICLYTFWKLNWFGTRNTNTLLWASNFSLIFLLWLYALGKKSVKIISKVGICSALSLLREVEDAFKTNDDFHVYTFLGCFVKYKCDYTILYNKNPEHTTFLLCCCFIGF